MHTYLTIIDAHTRQHRKFTVRRTNTDKHATHLHPHRNQPFLSLAWIWGWRHVSPCMWK